jgi:uncharacterized UBP type Zn finger protein
MSQAGKGGTKLAASILKLPSLDQFKDRGCTHLDLINVVSPSADGCEECLAMGDSWVHLRMCLICGHVGCCNDSKNKHATKHFQTTGHAMMRSVEPGENWLWCFVDQVGFQSD